MTTAVFEGVDGHDTWAARTADHWFVDAADVDAATAGVRVTLGGTAPIARCLGYLCSTAGDGASFVLTAALALGDGPTLPAGTRGTALLATPSTLPKFASVAAAATAAEPRTITHVTLHEGYVWVAFAGSVAAAAVTTALAPLRTACKDTGKGAGLLPAGARCLTFGPTDAVRTTLSDGTPAAPVAIAPLMEGLGADGVSEANPVGVASMPLAEQVRHLSLPLARAVALRHPGGAAGGIAGVNSSAPPATSYIAVYHSPAVHCKSCVSKICRKLKKTPFALTPHRDFHYNLEEKNLYVVLPRDTAASLHADVIAMLDEAELPAAAPIVSRTIFTFQVTNVVCKSCTALLRRALRPRKIDVSIEEGTLTVYGDANEDTDAVSAAVVSTVMGLEKFGIEFTGAEPHAMALADVLEVTVDARDAHVESLLRPPPPPGGAAPTVQEAVAPRENASSPMPELSEMATTSLLVTGMTCSSCAARVEGVVEDAGGTAVESVVVNASTGVAKVRHDPRQFPVEEIIRQIEGNGFGAKPFTDTAELRNTLTAASALEEKRRAAVVSLALAMPLMLLFMVFNRIDAVNSLLMTPVLRKLCIGPILQFFVATPVVVIYGRTFFQKAIAALSHNTFTMDVLVALGVGIAYIASFVALFSAAAGMEAHKDVKFHTASTLVAFLLAGRWMEQKAKAETTQALVSLMDMQPKRAIVVRDGQLVDVDVNDVVRGDEVRVHAGSAIPVDGVVIAGLIAVDEAMVTGESLPVTKAVGAKVAGGTTCVDGTATVRATEIGAKSCVAQILKLVSDAQQSKAPVQKFADKISGVFVPIVIAYAVLVFVVWLICGWANAYPASWRMPGESVFSFSLNFLIASLVVACPCAMGLATPTAVMVGTGVGAKHGVYIKGGEALEESSHVTSVVFDKTGTLSTGRIVVTDSNVFLDDVGGRTREGVLRLVMLAESVSTHPVAKAVSDHIQAQLPGGCAGEPVASHVTTPGKGIAAVVGGEDVRVGNVKFVLEPCSPPSSPRWQAGDILDAQKAILEDLPPAHRRAVQAATRWRDAGETVVLATVGPHAAAFAMSDGPKPEARAVVQHLQQQGVGVYLVTGDNRGAAHRFAGKVGIPLTHVRAEVLPGEKGAFVRSLQAMRVRVGSGRLRLRRTEVDEEEPTLMHSLTSSECGADGEENEAGGTGEVVAFVGDGINDAPALAQANVGVALGAGTAVAIDAADCVLSRSNLCDVATFLALSCATMTRIKLNFFWAFSYNVVVLPVAGGLLYPATQWQMPPAMGGLAMMFSSLFVVLSSLHLRRFKPPQIRGAVQDDDGDSI